VTALLKKAGFSSVALVVAGGVSMQGLVMDADVVHPNFQVARQQWLGNSYEGGR